MQFSRRGSGMVVMRGSSVVLFTILQTACGHGGNGGGLDAPGFVEAAHPSQPVVHSKGGPVLATPRVVPVFFANDATAQAQIESYLGMLVGSSFWTAVSQEY